MLFAMTERSGVYKIALLGNEGVGKTGEEDLFYFYFTKSVVSLRFELNLYFNLQPK